MITAFKFKLAKLAKLSKFKVGEVRNSSRDYHVIEDWLVWQPFCHVCELVRSFYVLR